MSYIPAYEASKALPVEHIDKELEDFAAAGQEAFKVRFSRSLPSPPSVPSTTWEEPEPPSPDTLLRDQETRDRLKSEAGAQFWSQVDDELGRIRAARDMDLLEEPYIVDLKEAAEANVKYRWLQQGLWDEQWDTRPYGPWKHELRSYPPPVKPSESVKDNGVTNFRTKRERRLCDIAEENQEVVRCAVDFQNRQSSRPCYQFVYQLDKEREWIKMGLSNQDQDHHANVDTRAYENVKSRWIRDCIWDDDWTLIPGTTWRHERPPKLPSPYEMFREADAYRAARLERAERPPRWYFMAPILDYILIAPRTMTNQLPNLPVSPKALSDPSGSNVLEPSSEVLTLPGIHSMTSRSPLHTDFRGPTRKLTGKAKPDGKIQGHNEPPTISTAMNTSVKPTRTNPKKKATQKQKLKRSQPCVAESRPVKMRACPNKKKNRPLSPVAKQEETTNERTTSRPRRAAASKAMKALMKATRP